MRVVEQDKRGGDDACWQRVAGLPHDEEDHRDRESSEDGGQGTKGNIWYVVRDIRVSNIVEQEVPIVPNKPAHEGEEEFSEGRVDIEEVGPL